MEYVGRKVKKQFDGSGLYTGLVRSYDDETKFFEIVYEDGDFEEMDLSEVLSVLVEDGDVESESVGGKSRLGRKPKKRARVERKQRGDSSGKFDEILVKECSSVSGVANNSNNLVAGGREGFRDEGCVNGNMMVGVEVKVGFDLNAGFNFKLNDHVLGYSLSGDGVEASVGVGEEEKKKRRGIDLNLDANGEMEENLEMGGKRECGFDLNLGVDEEGRDDRDWDDGVREVKESAVIMEEIVANGELKEVIVTQDFGSELLEKEESIIVEGYKVEGDVDQGKLKEEVTTPSIDFADGCGGEEGSSCRRMSRRKRRKVLENVDSLNETVLRRSTRRGAGRNIGLISSSSVVNEIPSYAAAVVLMEEEPEPEPEPEPVSSTDEPVEEPETLPPKLQLPPSSQNMDLDGMPVLDIFSIYACLRSFSTLLFLSPFELEDFVAALRCQSSNSLIDSIHVSILHTLRKHLEYLSKEGSESASDCLRYHFCFCLVFYFPVSHCLLF